MYSIISQQLNLISALRPITTAGAANTNGTIIDTADKDGLAYHIQTGTGVIGDTNIAVMPYESDLANMDGETTINNDYIVGGLPNISANNTDYKFGVVPSKRYVRLVFVTDANATVKLAATAVLKSEVVPST